MKITLLTILVGVTLVSGRRHNSDHYWCDQPTRCAVSRMP